MGDHLERMIEGWSVESHPKPPPAAPSEAPRPRDASAGGPARTERLLRGWTTGFVVGDDRATPPAPATVRIRFDGLPTGAYRDSLDLDEPFLCLDLEVVSRSWHAFNAAGGDRPLSIRAIEDMGGVLEVPVHVNGPAPVLGIGCGWRRTSSSVPGGLEEGEVVEFRLDLGGAEVRPARVLGRLAVEHWRVTLEQSAAAARLEAPDGSVARVSARLPLPVGRDGSAWAAVYRWDGAFVTVEAPDAPIDAFVPVSRVAGSALGGATYQLDRPVYELRAPKGAVIEVFGGRVFSSADQHRIPSPRYRSALVAPAPAEEFTVFVDGESRGLVTAEGLAAIGRPVIEFAELEPTPVPHNVRICVESTGDRLPTLFLRSADPELRNDVSGQPVYAAIITPRLGPWGRQWTTGTWRPDGAEGATARAWVPPGEYEVALETADDRHIVVGRTVVVTEDEVTDVEIDLDAATPLTVGARIRGGNDRRVLPFVLTVGGAEIPLVRPGTASRSDVVGDTRGRVWTIGTPPRSARLFMEAGAEGLVVPLRGASPGEASSGLDLVADLPPRWRVSAPLGPVDGGEIRGTVDGMQLVLPAALRWHPFELQGRAVRAIPGDRVEVCLRADHATGVVREWVEPRRVHVRDWWDATPEGLTLLGGGRGRFVRVTSALDDTAWLSVTPDPALDPARRVHIGRILPGETLELWIPNSAAQLLCFERRDGADPYEHAQEGAPDLRRDVRGQRVLALERHGDASSAPDSGSPRSVPYR